MGSVGAVAARGEEVRVFARWAMPWSMSRVQDSIRPSVSPPPTPPTNCRPTRTASVETALRRLCEDRRKTHHSPVTGRKGRSDISSGKRGAICYGLKNGYALHMRGHRNHVRIPWLEKTAGERAFPWHPNGPPRAGASYERHGRAPLTPSFAPVPATPAALRDRRPPEPTAEADGLPTALDQPASVKAACAAARISPESGEPLVARDRTSAPNRMQSRTMPSWSSPARKSAKSATPSA